MLWVLCVVVNDGDVALLPLELRHLFIVFYSNAEMSESKQFRVQLLDRTVMSFKIIVCDAIRSYSKRDWVLAFIPWLSLINMYAAGFVFCCLEFLLISVSISSYHTIAVADWAGYVWHGCVEVRTSWKAILWALLDRTCVCMCVWVCAFMFVFTSNYLALSSNLQMWLDLKLKISEQKLPSKEVSLDFCVRFVVHLVSYALVIGMYLTVCLNIKSLMSMVRHIC